MSELSASELLTASHIGSPEFFRDTIPALLHTLRRPLPSLIDGPPTRVRTLSEQSVEFQAAASTVSLAHGLIYSLCAITLTSADVDVLRLCDWQEKLASCSSASASL